MELVPEALHAAVCVRIIDIGSHKNPAYPDKPSRRRVVFFWELPGVTYEYEENGVKVTKPRVVSRKYAAGLGGADKPTETAEMLKSWRGRAFTEAERKGFDIFSMLGKGAQIQIIHEKSSTDATKVYANIKNILGFPPGVPAPEPSVKPSSWNIEELAQGLPETFPDWIKEAISESDEYKALSDSLASVGPAA